MAKILVLEDDKDLNKSVCTFLSLKNHEPIGFLNAEEAIESLENNKYDIIISDVMMNTMNGFEFAETVRSFNTTIPILFMTALDDINSKTKGYKIGIDDYMVKPVNLDELNLRIGALLKHSGMEEKSKITVRVNGEEVISKKKRIMAPGEMETLIIPKRILEKYEIIESIEVGTED